LWSSAQLPSGKRWHSIRSRNIPSWDSALLPHTFATTPTIDRNWTDCSEASWTGAIAREHLQEQVRSQEERENVKTTLSVHVNSRSHGLIASRGLCGRERETLLEIIDI
jgi:hypothetical protein